MKGNLVLNLACALFVAVAASTADEVRIPASEPIQELNIGEDTTGEELVYETESDQGSLLQSIQQNSTSTDTPIDENWRDIWTHQPVCTSYLSEFNSLLCVYTNATFSQGRGISIFTTPKIAAEFAALLPFHDDEILQKRGINSAEGSGLWTAKALPGKGIGMVAKRDLQRGELITAYTPYLISHAENVLSVQEREKFLQIALSQLPAASQEHFLDLAKYYYELSVVVQDVVKANTFQMDMGGRMHLLVVPEASRYNHACAPNAQYYIEPGILTHFVHAVRPIAKDEEITITYSTPYHPYSVRQNYLLEAFRFTCTCSRCAKGEDTDQSLVEIHDLQQSLGNWGADSTASVKQAERLVKVYLEEEFDGFLDFAYGHAALTYNSVGSARGTVKYAALAAEAAALKYGPASKDVRTWMDLAERPMEHSSWRRRKNVVVVSDGDGDSD
ncbi:hypothetical protein LTR84_009753 [Exophiala bonariae]|uniref:SET domain-containing protein n=1 Tax=Exophiala bonariae TaxID=1690606 RepID=A0AAV9NJB0_9EURO|nr:hypothetical protein LTR84_009753 [Exophiala bonariae]